MTMWKTLMVILMTSLSLTVVLLVEVASPWTIGMKMVARKRTVLLTPVMELVSAVIAVTTMEKVITVV